MINLSLRKVDFNELKIENLSKKPILESLKKFWQKSDNEFIEFLEKNNIDYYKNFSSIAELKESINQNISILNSIAEQNIENSFDFKTINLLKGKNLKEIQDYEFVKLTIDLKNVNDQETKTLIKDLFLQTQSASLIDFMDVDEDSCSLIYHKKGAFYYYNEPFICNAREQLTMLENYEVPKDNNFIVSRLLVDLANKFEDNGIDESFCVKYGNGEENIKNINEIIYWGNLDWDEKKELKAKIKEQKELNNEAKNQAKKELKTESNNNRQSLKSIQAQEMLEKEKNVRLYNVPEFQKEQSKEQVEIEYIVAKSINLYKQKEQEKLNIRLEKAQKDSALAYNDLREYLFNGLSILEAIKNIQQKYRNEDTINFASLLFSKDILNLRNKDEEIINLKEEKVELKEECEKIYDEVAKKEETISKLKSTLQTKINEMQNYEFELEKNYEEKFQQKEAEMLKELEKLQIEQTKINDEYELEIKELDSENEKLDNENKKINEINTKLIAQNEFLESRLKEQKNEFEILQKDFKNSLNATESNIKQFYKLEAQVESFMEKEKNYKEQIENLKNKNDKLESKIDEILNNLMQHNLPKESIKNEQKEIKKNMRSKDILGDI